MIVLNQSPNRNVLARLTASVFLAVYLILLLPMAHATEVGLWSRHAIVMNNPSFSRNAFELEVDATFTHTTTGTQITMPGYYHAGDVWKINFMPILLGEWTYVTRSTDDDLDNISGDLIAVDSFSDIKGFLGSGGRNGDKWQYADGQYVAPIALRIEVFMEPATDEEFLRAAQFMQSNNITMVESRLTEQEGAWDGGRHDYIFEGDWKNHAFDTDIWDRMERRMDMLRDHGLGAHIQFYSDDTGAPGWSGTSSTEALVIRYAVARLAAYPVIFWNTGIDIAEYRSQSEIDWFGARLEELDPYGHPRSSRRAGGSGSIIMANETFESWGDRRSFVQVIKDRFDDSDDQPVSMDDAWGENRPSHPDKNHTPSDIRRAFWMCVISGGSGGIVRGGSPNPLLNGLFQITQVEEELESEQWLRHITPFLRDHLGSVFGDMYADDSIVNGDGAYALRDSADSVLLYWQEGPSHTYSMNGSRSIGIDLDGMNGIYTGRWFDPRVGLFSPAGEFHANSSYQLTTPSPGDWLLLLTIVDMSRDFPPRAPTKLTAQ